MDTEKLRRQLVIHEGLRTHMYQDTVGKWTIGVGRNLSDVGISHGEAMMLLEHDLDAVITDLATFPWFAALDPVRQRVLCNIRFNLGPSRFRGFKRMLRLVSEGNYVLAAGAMRDSVWFRQTKDRGVRLTQMMVQGVDA